MRRSLVIVAAIALTWSPWSANAYPNRAGDCPEGTKAVGGGHLSSSAVQGSLPDGSLEISIDGDVLSRSTPYVVETGVDHTITLSGSNQFIGFLIRLGRGSSVIDTTSALSSSSFDAQIADVCVSDYSVGGICHANPTSLGDISGTLRLDEESEDMLLDVTVVASFYPSEYYHSTYTVHSRAAGSSSAPVAPTVPSAPVTTAPATTAPAAPTTSYPLPPPIYALTSAPNPAPYSSPTGGSSKGGKKGTKGVATDDEYSGGSGKDSKGGKKGKGGSKGVATDEGYGGGSSKGGKGEKGGGKGGKGGGKDKR